MNGGRTAEDGGRRTDGGRRRTDGLRPLLVLVCLLVWAWSGVCGGTETGPEMTASLVPNQTKVGGVITLTLRFQLPEGAHLASEADSAKVANAATAGPEVRGLEGFQVLDWHVALDEPRENNGGQKNSKMPVSGECGIQLMVTHLASGAVGPISLGYITAGGKKASIEAAPVPLTILSNLGDKPEAARLKPIYGIIPTGDTWKKYRFWILGGIALLLLGVICEWWIRKRRGKGTAVMDETPPDKLAIRGLKTLDAQQLFEKGRIKDFYFGLSEILRRYLEAIRGFPAAEYTLEEIARAAEKKEDQPLLTLLRRADMVKFADSTTTTAGKDEDMKTAFAYIQDTREPLMTEAATQRHGGKRIAADGPRTARRGTPS
ncbi:MAG: hypothetical protein JRD04_04075 [Deltaproteobacteria bacterium]|nr:hypothetical protein [Deltaproteobacteria bacterium]